MELSQEGFLFHLPLEEQPKNWEVKCISIEEAIKLRQGGQETKLVLGAQEEPVCCPDETLIHLIARATLLREQLETGQITLLADSQRDCRAVPCSG